MTAKTAHPALHANCQTNGPTAEMSYAYFLPLPEISAYLLFKILAKIPRYWKVLSQEEINKVLFEDTDEYDLDLSDEDGELDMSNTFQAADSSTLLESDSDSEDVEDCKYERQKINLTLACL
ncbi:hypothetical protein AVEN_176786-1 [Araneus ventricosus]|uniref:Uncharacterized protein n=1 Tax=Araneus ventricosus TaxID=182803 RepID=A0A4Y2RW68_ARAVE|nr:hypothetical protein AVEN_176786-1 [Araneus ventricosus]